MGLSSYILGPASWATAFAGLPGERLPQHAIHEHRRRRMPADKADGGQPEGAASLSCGPKRGGRRHAEAATIFSYNGVAAFACGSSSSWLERGDETVNALDRASNPVGRAGDPARHSETGIHPGTICSGGSDASLRTPPYLRDSVANIVRLRSPTRTKALHQPRSPS